MADIHERETQGPAATADSDNLDKIVIRRWPAGLRSFDPTLGDSVVFGPSLLVLLSCFGFGILGIGAGLLAPPAVWAILVGLSLGLTGLWAAQTSLVVGTRGFRSSGPLGSSEVGWAHVSRARSRYSFWLQARRIDVELDDFQVMELGYMAFSDSHDAISDLMEDCLAAWRQAHPAEAADGPRGLLNRPEAVSFSRGRRPVVFGLSAAALIAVVCLASAWRFGAFDGFLRGAPAAPQAGHWSGSNPGLSFDVGADGQMSNVSLDVGDIRFGWCTAWASAIPVAADHTFSSALGPTAGNLLSVRVELKGTFYGATASGTFRTVACPAPGSQGGVGGWSAQWVHA